MALCDGYDAMRLAMSKPHLRAELESDLKRSVNSCSYSSLPHICVLIYYIISFCRICDGTKNGAVVKTEQIAKYRNAFEVAGSKLERLEAACSHYLDEAPVPGYFVPP